MRKAKQVILGVTASVAIYKACDILRRLQERGAQVSVVMTQEAQELIRPVVFQALSGQPVYSGLFHQPEQWEIGHISLADKADLILVAPATANTIAKMAAGICDDMLTCIICATRAPVMVCPAMNENMWRNSITQDNLKKLKARGIICREPKKGMLACGKVGVGCLADVRDIVAAAVKYMSKR